MPEGRVIKTQNSFFYVKYGTELISCKLRGRFKKDRENVYTGDMVEFSLLTPGEGVIERLMPRKNLLHRPAVANIDQVVIEFAVTDPEPHPLLIDRFLVMAEWSGIPDIVLCFNKCDLTACSEMEYLLSFYRKIGYTVLEVSAQEKLGLAELRKLLSGKETVFAGPSGVGKSSLLNAVDEKLGLQTGTISDKIKRGKHTTRLACLMPYGEDGVIVDTPGFSSLDLTEIPAEDLAGYFPEFADYLTGCRFRGCLHSHEPECALKNAVEQGTVSSERYQSYLRFLQEIKERKNGQW